MSPRAQDRNCQTKIIATLGPASSGYEIIRRLYEEGVDIFRLNFSHGTHDSHRRLVENIRRVERDLGVGIGILADMQGPKLRIGTFKNDKIALDPEHGQTIRFDLDPAPGDETRVCFPHPDIIAVLEPGAAFLMDDGNVAMEIVEKGDGYFVAQVKRGTELSNRKGVNVPDLSRPVPAVTDKDKKDMAFALDELKVDWIAQSFVQTAADMAEARKIIAGRAGLMAKIEKPAAVKNFDEIVALSDAIMVARGDLGVEMPAEKLYALQKSLIRKTKAAGKPVVVATQMLDSMQRNPLPTRAEIADVGGAVLDRAQAVMLSGETAAGLYPVESVEMMDSICQEMEQGDIYSLKTENLPKAVVVLPALWPRRETLPGAPAPGPAP